MNPECRDGKHRNCDAQGWNLSADAPCVCPCACHRDSVAAVFEGEPVDASGRAHVPAGATLRPDPGEYTSTDIPTPEMADSGNTSSGRFRRVTHTLTAPAVLDEETGLVARFFGDTDDEVIEMADLQARTLNGDPSLTPLYRWRPAYANGGRVEGEEEKR